MILKKYVLGIISFSDKYLIFMVQEKDSICEGDTWGIQW